AWVCFEDRAGGWESASHWGCVAFPFANFQRWSAALRCAEHIARAAQFPVRFGHFKPVRRSFQNGELRRSLLGLAEAQQDAKRFVFAAADPAPKLVQLGETESLGVCNQHNSRIWHID